MQLVFHGRPVADEETCKQHLALNVSKSLPWLTPGEAAGKRLCVVGGGASSKTTLDEIKAFHGDVWGINQTAQWLTTHGVDATLFSVDPMIGAGYNAGNYRRAIVSADCNPEFVDYLLSTGKQVRLFHTDTTAEDGVQGGGTSASRVPILAGRMGYSEVYFYGCDSSYEDTTHHYRDDGNDEFLIVRAGERHYRSTPQMFMQALAMAPILAEFPFYLKCRSGGLLQGMIDHLDDWEVTHASDAMLHALAYTGDDGQTRSLYEQIHGGAQ